jgi:zinc transport system ATP-binding protein
VENYKNEIENMNVGKDTLVALDNAGLSISNKWLVREVTMKVNAGEIVTLIGPNGSGKSTTAKMALGIMAPSEGSVYRCENARVSYVPQRLSIDWTMPLDVNRFISLTRFLDKKAVKKALSMTETEHLYNAEVRTLSGGEFQRVLIARAIAHSPQFLVLDEPVQGVDFNGEIALYKLIENIRNELNCGIILISHDLHVVMSTTDRVICLNGHVCCSGTPAVVATEPEFRALFGDRAANELAFYKHQHDHEHLPDKTIKKINEGELHTSAQVERENTSQVIVSRHV